MIQPDKPIWQSRTAWCVAAAIAVYVAGIYLPEHAEFVQAAAWALLGRGVLYAREGPGIEKDLPPVESNPE
jgi:hypothetical protein